MMAEIPISACRGWLKRWFQDSALLRPASSVAATSDHRFVIRPPSLRCGRRMPCREGHPTRKTRSKPTVSLASPDDGRARYPDGFETLSRVTLTDTGIHPSRHYSVPFPGQATRRSRNQGSSCRFSMTAGRCLVSCCYRACACYRRPGPPEPGFRRGTKPAQWDVVDAGPRSPPSCGIPEASARKVDYGA